MLTNNSTFKNVSVFKIQRWIFFISILFAFNTVAQTPIAATTANRNFSMANTGFSNYEIPTASAVVSLNAGPLQAVIATTPLPGLYWDDYLATPHRGSILITAAHFNIPSLPSANITNILLDDIILTKPAGSDAAVAVITCRIMDNANVTHIALLRAVWNITTFSFNILQTTNEIDVRTTGTTVDWLDRVGISTHENGANTWTNQQEVFITWQEAGSIWISEGQVNFSTSNIAWYNVKKNIFPTTAGIPPGSTFRHPDISTKTSSYKTVVAIKITGTVQTLVGFDFQSEEGAGTNLTPSYGPGYLSLYSTTNSNEKLRTPRVEKLMKGSFVAVVNKLNSATKKSTMVLSGYNLNGQQLTSLTANAELENLCTNNYNYEVTGSPSIALAESININFNNFEITWQQVECGDASNYCTVNAISKRYTLNSSGITLTPNTPASGTDNYFHINADLTVNSLFSSIATLRLNYCANFYSFGIMNKGTNSNGIIVNKKAACNGTSLRTGYTANHDQVVKQSISPNTEVIPEILAYPNPANTFIRINMANIEGDASIYLYDNIGTIVASMKATGKKLIELNTATLIPGGYYLKVITGKGVTKTQRMVLLH